MVDCENSFLTLVKIRYPKNDEKKVLMDNEYKTFYEKVRNGYSSGSV